MNYLIHIIIIIFCLYLLINLYKAEKAVKPKVGRNNSDKYKFSWSIKYSKYALAFVLISNMILLIKKVIL